MENFKHLAFKPCYGYETYVAPQSVVLGHVTIGNKCSIWPFASLRGDVEQIHIGNGTNIQENVVVHVSGDADVQIGDYVTVGHGAIVHGCHIGSHCLIGMHATILDGAKIGDHCIIGAQTLITQNKEIPPYSLVLGSPGKVVRTLTEEDLKLIEHSAQVYIDALKYWI